MLGRPSMEPSVRYPPLKQSWYLHTGPRMALSSKLPLPSNRSDANARQAPSDTQGVKI